MRQIVSSNSAAHPVLVLACVLLSIASPSSAQQYEEKVLSYVNVGRIKFHLPKDPDYFIASPEFSNGPRIRKQTADEDFRIGVYQSLSQIESADAKQFLVSELEPFLSRAIETRVDVKTFGTVNPVFLATIRDKNAKGPYKYMTRGIGIKEDVLFLFGHLSNDDSGQMLNRLVTIIQTAELLDSSPNQPGGEQRSNPVLPVDTELLAAEEEARNRLGEFFRVMATRQPNTSKFQLQVRVSDNNGFERIWIDIPGRFGGLFSGIVIARPDLVTKVRQNQHVFFRRSDITDWAYTENNKVVGYFSKRVLISRLPKDEQDRAKGQYGWE